MMKIQFVRSRELIFLHMLDLQALANHFLIQDLKSALTIPKSRIQ
ncbi:hypothetical protein SAMN04487970_10117 [Paenibacillus tianmuensis]|uniref:Uncharacterized protein n=1 Tax=Paenibacillus tianmuensis TaxID=624147 RepID=A0A1G4R0W8_9BACL|nr:hypothetical protein SAMN04487970_10117 [Paenibacillus tianmuensis]